MVLWLWVKPEVCWHFVAVPGAGSRGCRESWKRGNIFPILEVCVCSKGEPQVLLIFCGTIRSCYEAQLGFTVPRSCSECLGRRALRHIQTYAFLKPRTQLRRHKTTATMQTQDSHVECYTITCLSMRYHWLATYMLQPEYQPVYLHDASSPIQP